MGNEKEDRSSALDGRKRLRENGSQTDEDEHVAAMTQRSSTDARFDSMQTNRVPEKRNYYST